MTHLIFLSLSALAATSVQVPLKDSKGASVGTATLTELKQGVKIDIDAKGLSPGEHAVHFHQSGVCKAPDFKSAGEHFSPRPKQHGFDTEGGAHAGDMPNLVADQNGKASAEIVNTQVSLQRGPASLLKEGGTALVIHEGPDDYKTQPAGASGGRVACGEIQKTK